MIDVALLHEQALRYPQMQPRDLMKFLYQSECGPEHLISDPDRCLLRLQSELQQIAYQPDIPLVEPLAGDFVRLQLAGADPAQLPAALINRMFLLSAKFSKPLSQLSEDLLCAARQAVKAGCFSFDITQWEEYLTQYRAQGCPAVSHSAEYKAAYAPAYRVIHQSIARLLPLICRIHLLLQQQERVVVAIDGMAASGKSTAAALLAKLFDDTAIIHMDDFFLPDDLRTPKRLSEPGGNVHYERFKQEVVCNLRSDSAFSYRIFDCSVRDFTQDAIVPPARLMIVEGSYAHHPYFEDPYDLRVFLQISEEEQKRRILNRDGAVFYQKFMNIWVPMEQTYNQTFDISKRCDLLL